MTRIISKSTIVAAAIGRISVTIVYARPPFGRTNAVSHRYDCAVGEFRPDDRAYLLVGVEVETAACFIEDYNLPLSQEDPRQAEELHLEGSMRLEHVSGFQYAPVLWRGTHRPREPCLTSLEAPTQRRSY